LWSSGLLLFPLTYGVASSAYKYYVKQEVLMEKMEVDDQSIGISAIVEELVK
jgi:hypothetical protein